MDSCVLSFQYWDEGDLNLFKDSSVYANRTLELLMFANIRLVKLPYHNCYLTLERMKIIYTTLGILQCWVYEKDTNYGMHVPLRLFKPSGDISPYYTILYNFGHFIIV